MEGEKVDRLEEERKEVEDILERIHDTISRGEMDLHRIESMGYRSPEISQARIRLQESKMWIKLYGHDGRWKE